jgi:two-component system OmpR family response regulator
MSIKNKVKLFLVDDDVVYLKMLEIEFQESGDYDIETFVSGEQCIKNLPKQPNIIILDYLLDGINKNAINGIETLDKIKFFDPEIPVIILSQQDKIDVAVDCMHHRALDYVVKSETAYVRLKKIIAAASEYQKLKQRLGWYMERM